MIGFQKDGSGYWITKDPNAAKNYTIDFTKWLVDGDTLNQVVWTVPAGLEKIAEGITPDGKKAWIKLGGGELNKNYVVNAHITTLAPLEDDVSFRVVIREN